MKRRGFTIAEMLVALFVLFVAFAALWTVFSGSSSQAVKSRNHTVALLFAQSFLEEVRAHPYGTPEPRSWKQSHVRPVKVRVEGREQALEFRQEISYANKSFIGQSDHDSDEITLKLTWDEGEKKHLEVRTAVWR